MKVDLITINYGTWEIYTKRLIRMVEYYTNPDLVNKWFFCDNASSDIDLVTSYSFKLPTTVILGKENINDIPRYNDIIHNYCTSDIIIAISPDVRIFDHGWINTFTKPFNDMRVGMVGCSGPGANMTPAYADYAVGGGWNWIPQLLIDRNIPFKTCEHVQTHCFAIRRKAFIDVGEFWTPSSDEFLSKGHMIASEVAMGTKMHNSNWKLNYEAPKMYHYGNKISSKEELDAYDKSQGWRIEW
jgi:hypothetical protein